MTSAAGRIVIAGGGIGGLAASLALARLGVPSLVCERRAAFAEDGAGIQIGPNGVKILQALGAGDGLRPSVAAPDALSIRNGVSGVELTRLPLGGWITQRHGAPYWTAHRKDLHAALSACAGAHPLIELRLNCEITAWSDTADAAEALTTTGDRIPARALIAADGLWSQLRNQVCQSAPPTPVGKSAFRCVVQRSHLPAVLAANDVHIWMTPGAHAVHYPVRSRREIALVLIVDDARNETKWSVEAAPDLTRADAASFAPALRALLEAGDGWRHWSLHKSAPLDRWTNGRVALLGDAAHAVLPFLAQGAVLALEDAVVLADCFAAQADDVPAALAKYAALRRPRADRIAAAAARNGHIYHLSGAIRLARDAILRAAPPSRLMAGYDWLYGWEQ